MDVYDDKISSTVSLSKILDCYVIDREPAKVVCQFLKKYDEHFKDILDNSLVSERIYQLDYLRTCSSNESYYLLNHLEDIDPLVASICIWQLLRCPDKELKAEAQKHVENCIIAHRSYIQHPYSRFRAKSMHAFDQCILDGCSIENFLNSMPMTELMTYLKNANCSLFASRLYQYDVFENCDVLHKYIMIQNVRNLQARTICNFTMQVLMSSENPEIKYALICEACKSVDLLDTQYFDKTMNSELCKMISSCQSYPELAIHLQLYGDDMSHDVVLHMLMHNQLDLLYEFLEMDEETLQKIFPIRDLLNYMKSGNLKLTT